MADYTVTIKNEEKPLSEKIRDYGSMVELGGYAGQMFKNPYALGLGTIAAAGGGLARTWGNYAAGNQSLGSALIESAGDIGFPLLGIVAPQLGQTRAFKALSATKAAEDANRTQKALNAMKNAGKAATKYGMAAGTTGFINYGLPGMVESGTLNPLYGFDYLQEDIDDFSESPGARFRLATTFALPAAMHYMSKRVPKAGAAESPTVVSETPRTVGETPRTTVTEPPRTAATEGPTTRTVADAFDSNSPVLIPIITAGGLGVASTTSAQPQYNGMSGNAAALASKVDSMSRKKVSSKKQQKPKTTTGTYTGKPSNDLLSGIIIGRKNGGKLNNLINLRNAVG